MISQVIESILFFLVKIPLYAVRAINFIARLLGGLIEFFLTIAAFFGLGLLLKEAGPPWIMISMLSLAFLFLCFLILFFWRRKKLERLLKKILK